MAQSDFGLNSLTRIRGKSPVLAAYSVYRDAGGDL
jgi:hypothetical protein